QIRQRKIRSRIAPLIEQTGLSAGDQCAAARDETPNRADLLIRHRTDVRQDQHRKVLSVAIEMIEVKRNKRNSRANQRLGKTAQRLLDQFIRVVAPVEVEVP